MRIPDINRDRDDEVWGSGFHCTLWFFCANMTDQQAGEDSRGEDSRNRLTQEQKD